MDALLKRDLEEQAKMKDDLRRKELQRKLQLSQDTFRSLEEKRESLEKVLDELLDTHVVGEDGDPPSLPEPSLEDFAPEEVEALKTRDSLRSLADCYSSLGLVVENVEEGKMQVAFHTHQPGQRPCPAFRVLLQLSPPALLGHRVPGFVPVWKLAKEHLSVSIADFLRNLRPFLQAFSRRMAAVDVLKDSHGDQVEVLCTEPVDHVSLTVTVGGRHATSALVKLTFSDLLSTAPDEVTISPRADFRAFGKVAVKNAELAFLEGKLSEGVGTLISSIQNP